MKNRGVPIVQEGWPFIGLFFFSFVAFAMAGWFFLAFVFVVATLFSAYFFRNPERIIPIGANTIASPADGKIIYVGPVIEPDIYKDERIKISIFMSVFNVHVNRAPIDGTLSKRIHHPGQFLAAFDERASDENERIVSHIESKNGFSIVLVQIAGLIARRIILYLEE